jgi:hypothetical protein
MTKREKILTLIIILLSIYILIFYFRNDQKVSDTVPQEKSETPLPLKSQSATTSEETDAIRNRPFPMQDYGNDAGMETGDDEPIEPINREPVTPNTN